MMIVAVMMIFFCPAAAEARMSTSPPLHDEARGEGDRDVDSPCTTAAFARTAQQICVGTPIGEALLSVRLRPEAAVETARSLAGLGLRDVLDLQLLMAGGPEVEELLSELKASRLNLGDRAKVRLLIGDRAHLGRLSAPIVAAADSQQQAVGSTSSC